MKTINIIAVILLFITACDDIIETDISEEKVILLAPSDNITTNETNITFWWEEILQADSYNLQVVSESFSNIHKIISDTIIFDTKFSVAMNSGKYEWKVKALNSISETDFTTFSFDIIETDISEEIVTLLYPPNNNTITETNITFWWEEILQADSYNLQVVSESFTNINEIISDTTIYTHTYSIAMDTGNFEWRVKAFNSSSETDFTTFSFTIDTTESK